MATRFASLGQSLMELLIALFVLCALFFATIEIYNKGSQAISKWRWNDSR